MTEIGVLGASGMIGMQLTRLLSGHPRVGKVRPFSHRLAGQPFSAVHPAFRDLAHVSFQRPTDSALNACDVLFASVPEYTPYLDYLRERRDLHLIDVGSEFRLDSAREYEKVHESEHPAADLIDRFVCVIPEINSDALGADRWVATQGCVPTAVALGLYPLVKEGLLAESHVTVDAKVASSGGGNTSNSYALKHFNRTNGVRAHRLLDEHRHCAELRSYLRRTLGTELSLDINVFSVDLVRGISAAAYVRLPPGLTEKQVRRLFTATYAEHPLVRVLKLNEGEEKYPNPKWLCGTGLCEIGFKVDLESGRAVIISALDNLMKGGASQAIQVFNLMHGFEATDGIPRTPIYP